MYYIIVCIYVYVDLFFSGQKPAIKYGTKKAAFF